MDPILYAALAAGVVVGFLLRQSPRAGRGRRAAGFLLDATILVLVASVGARTAPVLGDLVSGGELGPLLDVASLTIAPIIASLLLAFVVGELMGWGSRSKQER